MSEQDVGPQYRGELVNLTGQPQNVLPRTSQKGPSVVFRPVFANWHTRKTDTEQFATLLVDKGGNLV